MRETLTDCLQNIGTTIAQVFGESKQYGAHDSVTSTTVPVTVPVVAVLVMVWQKPSD